MTATPSEGSQPAERLLPEAIRFLKNLCRREALLQGGLRENPSKASTRDLWQVAINTYPFPDEIANLQTAFNAARVVDTQTMRGSGRRPYAYDFDSTYSKLEVCFEGVTDPLARRILTTILITRCTSTYLRPIKTGPDETPRLFEGFDFIVGIDFILEQSEAMLAELSISENDNQDEIARKTSADSVIRAVLEGRLKIDYADEPEKENPNPEV